MIYNSAKQNMVIGCPFCRADPCDISYSKGTDEDEDEEGSEDDEEDDFDDEETLEYVYNHGTMCLGEVDGIPNLIDTNFGMYVPMCMTSFTKQEINEYNEMSREDTRTNEINKVRYYKKKCMDLIETIFEECMQINSVLSMLRSPNPPLLTEDDEEDDVEGIEEETNSVCSDKTQWTDISSDSSWTNLTQNTYGVINRRTGHFYPHWNNKIEWEFYDSES